jgi:hypothetical protein
MGLVTAALAGVAGLFVAFTLPPPSIALQPGIGGAPPTTWTVVPGAYHVHTTRSDGTGTIDEVASAAARAGLRFVIFTDHGDGLRRPDPPTYRAGVLCLDGVEISTTEGHYAVIGMGQAPYPLGGESRDVVEDVARLGGFGIAAHPTSPKAELQWREWAVPLDGIEWLNADSEWRDETWPQLARGLIDYLFRPPESLASLLGRPEAALVRWDALTRHRRVVGLAGLDAHARFGGQKAADPHVGGVFLRLPSYESLFRTLSLRVEVEEPWRGDAAHDAASLLAEIKAGHVYTAIDAIAGPPSFEFTARSGSHTAREGDVLEVAGPVDLEASTNAPPGSTLVLMENGRIAREVAGPHLRYTAHSASAVFRVEVRVPLASGGPRVPWIVSNSVYAGGPAEAQAIFGPPSTNTVLALIQPGRNAAYHIEHDARSEATVSPTSRPAGAGLVFAYALGGGPPAGQFTALVLETTSPLIGGSDRVSFRASSDRPMRCSIQVRQPGADRDGARWQRSIYVDSAPREISVCFDDMRPVARTMPTHPDLSQVDAVLIVVDTTNTRPATAGRMWLEQVRLEHAAIKCIWLPGLSY